jgi:hypothetical protein
MGTRYWIRNCRSELARVPKRLPLMKRMPIGNTRTVLVAEDDPEVFTSDRHITFSVTRPTSRCSEPLSAPNAFHAVDVKQRHAPLNVIWEAAG